MKSLISTFAGDVLPQYNLPNIRKCLTKLQAGRVVGALSKNSKNCPRNRLDHQYDQHSDTTASPVCYYSDDLNKNIYSLNIISIFISQSRTNTELARI